MPLLSLLLWFLVNVSGFGNIVVVVGNAFFKNVLGFGVVVVVRGPD